ncbi:hypothetical protein [Pseudonocardia lacus]|uniref:hypothetical protein n=1 Tax=Pseudonocardia lacus TaxID=2835865 RepID=UPI001BDBEB9E|nr:hypothetical protein [Pseudonocardia lacus]
MLKKAGILVGVVAAGVIAITPFAFAGDHHESSSEVNYSNVESGNVGNDCEFGQAGSQVDQNLVGGSSLVAAAGAVTGAVTPADTQTQLLNCTNVSLTDLVDSGSGNETRTLDVTEVEDSYNSDTTLGG